MKEEKKLRDKKLISTKDQATCFRKLESNSNYRSNFNDFSYIISKTWLDKFKLYVGIDNFYGSKSSKNSINPQSTVIFPGPILNDDILEPEENYEKTDDLNDPENLILKEGCKEHCNFEVVESEMWDFLYNIYGGNPIKRVKYYFNNDLFTEVFFRRILFLVLPPREKFVLENIVKPKPLYISRSQTVKYLKEKIFKIINNKNYNLNINTLENIRLWKFESNKNDIIDNFVSEISRYFNLKEKFIYKENDNKYEYNYQLKINASPADLKEDISLEELEFSDNHLIIVEQKDSEGHFLFKRALNAKLEKCEFCTKWQILSIACKCNKVFYCSKICQKKDKKFHSSQCPHSKASIPFDIMKDSENKGVKGLQNLGNTCYMNSGLQCVINSWPLTNYFLYNIYEKEINVTNILGKNGKLAIAYAKLLKRMYFDDSPSISPSELKNILGQVNQIFVGFAQNDSHELISELLDGLHEDLNRITQKPYVEAVEKENNQSIHDYAKISWLNHLKRNQSIIVDLFHGQFLSEVTCPDCHNTSYKMDPYASISLPIPVKKGQDIRISFIPFLLDKPVINKTIFLKENILASEIRNLVKEKFNLGNHSYEIGKLTNDTFDYLFSNTQTLNLKEFKSDKIGVFEIDNEIIESFDSNHESKSDEIMNKKSKENKSIEEGSTIRDNLFFVTLILTKQNCNGMASSKKANERKRVIALNKNFSLEKIHRYIFKYLSSFLRIENNDSEKMDLNNLFKFYQLHNPKSKKRPYILNYISQYNEKDKTCVFCKNKNCNNCVIPFSNTQTLDSELKKTDLDHLLENDLIYAPHSKWKGKASFEIEVVIKKNFEISNIEIETEPHDSKSKSRSRISIYDMFDEFQKENTLSEKNKWYCPWCKQFKRASKKMMIYSVPPILILQLKRFKNNHLNFSSGGKFDELIEYPIDNLNISKYVYDKENEMNYDLFAVSEHYGGLCGGHYTAHVYNWNLKKWFYCNDSSCVESNQINEIVSPAGYVLFYKRKDLFDYDLKYYEKIKNKI